MGIKLLVIDDSAFMRRTISDIVEEIEGIEVVGIGRDGLIDITIEALQIGTYDFIEKPKDLKLDLSSLREELSSKIINIFNSKHLKKKIKVKNFKHKERKDIKAVVIGASTGGPKALVYLISNLPDKINVPIFIVQHMPSGFTTSLALGMDKESNIKVVEAIDGMNIQNNMVYLAPGDFHMTLKNGEICLDTKDKLHGVRPAADYLFDAAAEIYRENLLGIILTGMGKDGTAGMSTIKNYGGYNIAQSEESCVVYGMPGSAVSKGVVDEILDLEEISHKLNKLIGVI